MRFSRHILGLLVAAVRLSAFEPALPGYEFAFPRDHFEHNEFQTEWWYYTGNLEAPGGRRFGFELTFFRIAVERETLPESDWDVEQVYLAHFAVSDIAAARFHKAERLNRAGPGLAGASRSKGLIWNGNWSSRWLFEGPGKPSQRLLAMTEDASLNLLLRTDKPPVVHGRDGISRKAGGPGKASHYISFTRLRATGTLALHGRPYEVKGTAWMDHEFSTDSMDPSQVGWDWMSVQLDDGNELMLYGMRTEDGRHDEFTSGTFVDADGRPMHLGAEDFSIVPGRTWRSNETGAIYPVAWTIRVPQLGYRLACEALIDAQEVTSPRGATPTYWEGAVRYSGERGDTPVTGVGYLEMTGYEKPVWLGLSAGRRRPRLRRHGPCRESKRWVAGPASSNKVFSVTQAVDAGHCRRSATMKNHGDRWHLRAGQRRSTGARRAVPAPPGRSRKFDFLNGRICQRRYRPRLRRIQTR